jgi:phospholipid/cholesterol/gamma-HCH transport system permease protein
MNRLARHFVADLLEFAGGAAMLAKETVRSLFIARISWREVVRQIHFVGVKSQSVDLITGAFTGMVMCAQTYFQFHKIKMDTATLAVVAVSMASELGPVLTSLMVAGRIGSSIAAELGTMKVTEQIDALRTLAAHPVDYLVVPRMIAILIAMPLLTAESISVGIGAGYLVGVHLLKIDPAYLWHNTSHYTESVDMIMGFIKSLCFGAIIGLVGCYKGLTCSQGAEGVGKSTTESVVYASITILISNFFLTLVLQRLLGQ